MPKNAIISSSTKASFTANEKSFLRKMTTIPSPNKMSTRNKKKKSSALDVQKPNMVTTPLISSCYLAVPHFLNR